MKINKIIKIVLISILAFLAILLFMEFRQQPHFSYDIQTFEPTDEISEMPMETTSLTDEKGIEFKVIFSDDRDNTEKVKLMLENKFTPQMPFLNYSDLLTVQLINKDNLSEDDQIIYQISGKITGLKPSLYKLKVIDPNGNLVDEKVITIE